MELTSTDRKGQAMKEKIIDRTKFIGASEVGILLGMNPFSSPLKLWSKKVGLAQQEEQRECFYWGTKKEQIIADRFAEDHKVKLMAYKKRFVHKTMPYFSCELDRIIVGSDTIVECKTSTEYNKQAWEGEKDELPEYIIAQVTAQMGLTGRKEAWVACLIGSSTYVEKLVKFDQELYAIIEEKVAEFWKMVLDKNPPMAIRGDDDALVTLYPEASEDIQLVQEMESAIALRQELSGQVKELKQQQDEVEIKLKEAINDSLGVKTSSYICTWRPTTTRRFDTKAFTAAHPDMAAGFYNETTGRRLHIKANKQKGAK